MARIDEVKFPNYLTVEFWENRVNTHNDETNIQRLKNIMFNLKRVQVLAVLNRKNHEGIELSWWNKLQNRYPNIIGNRNSNQDNSTSVSYLSIENSLIKIYDFINAYLNNETSYEYARLNISFEINRLSKNQNELLMIFRREFFIQKDCFSDSYGIHNGLLLDIGFWVTQVPYMDSVQLRDLCNLVEVNIKWIPTINVKNSFNLLHPLASRIVTRDNPAKTNFINILNNLNKLQRIFMYQSIEAESIEWLFEKLIFEICNVLNGMKNGTYPSFEFRKKS